MKQRSLPVPFVLVAIVVTLLIVFALNFPNKPGAESKTIAPIPTPINGVIANQADVPSPDGTHVLTMKIARNSDGSVVYTFIAADASGNTHIVFTKAVGPTGSMMIPPNSWSPDNRYLFIEERDGGTTHFYVFKTDGQPFPQFGPYEDITPLFTKAQPKLTLKDVTGWDSTDLLHVTSTNGAIKGPNFWFVVETGGFMQLY